MSFSHSFLPLFVIILAGSLAALQAPINAALGQGIGSSTAAAAISFGIGFIALFGVLLVTGDATHLSRTTSVNPWLLLGGCLGAFYVWAILWVIPVLGVVTAISAMILGQLAVALFLDASGLFSLPVSQITPQRILAVLMVTGGLILSKL